MPYAILPSDESVEAAFRRILREEAEEAVAAARGAGALGPRVHGMRKAVKKLRGLYPDLPIIARARDAGHAAELYRAGASHAVPETLEASLQLSEAVLVDLGVAMGPVIASIHEKRDELRAQIMEEGELEHKPKLKSGTLSERVA